MDRQFARLVNAGGELIAEGACHIEEGERRATLEAEREPGEVLKARGDLRITLESGDSFPVSDRPVVFRISPRPSEQGRPERRTLYRFHMISSHDTEVVAEGGSIAR
jgi:hypothetical protein